MTQNKINIEEIRISFLFTIENPVDDTELEQRLIDKKYKVNKDRVITRPPLRAVLLNVARKGGVDIIYEKNKEPFIGVVGKKKEDVMQEFEGLKFILDDIDRMLVDEARGVEVVVTSNVFDKHVKPENSLVSFALPQIREFNKALQKEYHMDNFRLRSQDGDDLTTVHIAPLYRDPRYFYMQLHLRSPSLEKAFAFVEKQETYINDILGVLGKHE